MTTTTYTNENENARCMVKENLKGMIQAFFVLGIFMFAGVVVGVLSWLFIAYTHNETMVYRQNVYGETESTTAFYVCSVILFGFYLVNVLFVVLP